MPRGFSDASSVLAIQRRISASPHLRIPNPESPIPAPHVPAYASPTPPRSGDVAGTLRLLTYLALSVALIVLDHRGDVLTQVRAQANLAVQPLWWLAGLPGRLGDSVRDDAVTRSIDRKSTRLNS